MYRMYVCLNVMYGIYGMYGMYVRSVLKKTTRSA